MSRMQITKQPVAILSLISGNGIKSSMCAVEIDFNAFQLFTTPTGTLIEKDVLLSLTFQQKLLTVGSVWPNYKFKTTLSEVFTLAWKHNISSICRPMGFERFWSANNETKSYWTNLLLTPRYAPGLGNYIDWGIMLVSFLLSLTWYLSINL